MKTLTLQPIARGITILNVFLLWILLPPVTAFFWSLFIVWAVFRLDPRVIGTGALIVLILIPVALSSELYEWMADQLTVYVFYLLCITVTLQILELRRGSRNNDDVPPPQPKKSALNSERYVS